MRLTLVAGFSVLLVYLPFWISVGGSWDFSVVIVDGIIRHHGLVPPIV